MSTIKLHIENTHIDTRSGVSPRTHNPYSISEQAGRLTLPNGEVRNVQVGVEPGQPLAVGEYVPKSTAWFMDKFNEPKLSLRGKHWEAAQAARVAKAA